MVFRIWKQFRRACRRRSGPTRRAPQKWRGRLFQTPEGSIRLHQLEARIPRFMAAPDNLGVGFAAGLWMDQPHALVQGNIRSHDCQTPSVAHVNSYGVGTFLGSALLPLYLELHSGNNAFVASKPFPPFL